MEEKAMQWWRQTLQRCSCKPRSAEARWQHWKLGGWHGAASPLQPSEGAEPL